MQSLLQRHCPVVLHFLNRGMLRMKTRLGSRWLKVRDRSVLKLGSLELGRLRLRNLWRRWVGLGRGVRLNGSLGLGRQLQEKGAQYRCGRQCTQNLHQAILLAVEATHRNLPAKRGYGGLRSSDGAEKSRGTMGGSARLYTGGGSKMAVWGGGLPSGLLFFGPRRYAFGV